jgi:hypothetical protein
VTSDTGGRPFTTASVDSRCRVMMAQQYVRCRIAAFSAGQLGALVGYIRQSFNEEFSLVSESVKSCAEKSIAVCGQECS